MTIFYLIEWVMQGGGKLPDIKKVWNFGMRAKPRFIAGDFTIIEGTPTNSLEVAYDKVFGTMTDNVLLLDNMLIYLHFCVDFRTEERGAHHDHVQITLEIDGENFVLDLTLNKQLLPKGFFYKHQENGKHKIKRPTTEEVELCQYNGKVRGKPDSWVALSTCNGLSGVIFDGIEMHYIEKDMKSIEGGLDVPHFLYKHSDLEEHNKTCGYGGDAYKRDADENELLVRGPYNANKESKYVELVLVIDNQEFKELGESNTRVYNHAKTLANIINGLYSPLNIFIALVGVVIWNEQDEINFSPNGDTTLTNFLHYRREKLIKQHPNDNAQLLTKFNFDNGVVGKALKGPICTYEYSGGVNTDHSSVVGLVATTVAHEMGHNFDKLELNVSTLEWDMQLSKLNNSKLPTEIFSMRLPDWRL
ncbi:hypothetical protein NQ317_008193 [Molorchus minor]|uniref:Peptidase M12B domain-containing protein n=1 Tax=Molorchus minor TaxID=1323400 RepID=A0ABQ9J4Q4_9CUCU|nr:hypothetical protein NQ317_008193 [Molorchus minor]